MPFENIEVCGGYGQVPAGAVIGAGDALAVLACMFACSILGIHPGVVLTFLWDSVFAALFFVFFANQGNAFGVQTNIVLAACFILPSVTFAYGFRLSVIQTFGFGAAAAGRQTFACVRIACVFTDF